MGKVVVTEFISLDGVLTAWPAMEEAAGELGAKMNAMPKVVVSTTLTDPAWKNTTVASGELPGTVAALKERYSGWRP